RSIRHPVGDRLWSADRGRAALSAVLSHARAAFRAQLLIAIAGFLYDSPGGETSYGERTPVWPCPFLYWLRRISFARRSLRSALSIRSPTAWSHSPVHKPPLTDGIPGGPGTHRFHY